MNNEENKAGISGFSGDAPSEYEIRELRIIKQAIAKSFLESGQTDLDLTPEVEERIEKWIRWIYRNEERDWGLIKNRERPF